MTKYHIDDTVAREKARLVMKGFTQVYGTDYDETYVPVSSHTTLKIFLSTVAVLDLNLMHLDMKIAFLQSKLDKHCDAEVAEGAARGRLRAAQDLAGGEVSRAGDHARQADEEVVAAPAKLLRQAAPVSIDAYAELTLDDEEAQERQEEEYRQKVGLQEFATTTTRPDIAFAFSKPGSGLTMRSDQHWRKVNRCLAYLANTRDTALEFGGKPELLELVGYVDANDLGDK
ncbi:unnamed protein product [Closterium sp. NIES-53]